MAKSEGEDMREQSKVEKLLQNQQRFLKAVADEGKCKGCGSTIYWFKTKAGKAAPYDADLVSHFATCPAAQRFKRG